MNESMVERVARAIDPEAFEKWAFERQEPMADSGWLEAVKASRQYDALARARTAIASMRECSGQMVEAGAEELAPYALDEGKWSAACEQVLDIWPAMIDVALCLPRDGR